MSDRMWMSKTNNVNIYRRGGWEMVTYPEEEDWKKGKEGRGT